MIIMSTRHIAFTIVLSLLMAGIFSSCKKEEIGIEYRPVPDIQGQWQVITVGYWDDGYLEFITPDYRSNNIIYDFGKNNTLTVSGEIAGIEDYGGHSIGEYPYDQIPNPVGTNLPSRMKVGNEEHYYSPYGWVYFDFHEGRAMSLSSPKDSPKRASIFLVRIESTDSSSKT